MNGHFLGVEAASHKIMAKYYILRQVSDFGPILDEEVTFSRLSLSNHCCHPHQSPSMDLPDGMNVHFPGVEATSYKIMTKHCILRHMSDLGPILDEEVAFSRLRLSIQVYPSHHSPSMDLPDGMNVHFPGVEAVPHKMTAENLIFADFRILAPSAACFVLSWAGLNDLRFLAAPARSLGTIDDR